MRQPAANLQGVSRVEVLTAEVMPTGDTREDPGGEGAGGLSKGALAGIAAGSALLAVGAVVGAFVRHRKNRMRMIAKGNDILDRIKMQLGKHDYSRLSMSEVEVEALGHMELGGVGEGEDEDLGGAENGAV